MVESREDTRRRLWKLVRGSPERRASRQARRIGALRGTRERSALATARREQLLEAQRATHQIAAEHSQRVTAATEADRLARIQARAEAKRSTLESARLLEERTRPSGRLEAYGRIGKVAAADVRRGARRAAPVVVREARQAYREGSRLLDATFPPPGPRTRRLPTPRRPKGRVRAESDYAVSEQLDIFPDLDL